MKINQRNSGSTELFKILPQAISSFKKNIIEPIFGEKGNEKYADRRLPFRSELFTGEQMENHARELAARHILISQHPSEQLLKRLRKMKAFCWKCILC